MERIIPSTIGARVLTEPNIHRGLTVTEVLPVYGPEIPVLVFVHGATQYVCSSYPEVNRVMDRLGIAQEPESQHTGSTPF